MQNTLKIYFWKSAKTNKQPENVNLTFALLSLAVVFPIPVTQGFLELGCKVTCVVSSPMFFISSQVFLVSSHTLGQFANVLRQFADVIGHFPYE